MRYVFAVLVLVFLSGVLLAQSSGINTPIPACSQSEAQRMIRLLSRTGVGEKYSALLTHAGSADFDTEINLLVSESIELRELYYRRVLPDVPDCAAARQVSGSFGKVVNDLTVSLSMIQIGINDETLKDIQDYGISLAQTIAEDGDAALEDLKQLAALAGEVE